MTVLKKKKSLNTGFNKDRANFTYRLPLRQILLSDNFGKLSGNLGFHFF